MERAAEALSIKLPKNLGDVVYSIRYRTPMPASILETQPKGKEWIVEGAGRARYRFTLVPINRIVPNRDLVTIKIPDATPEIIGTYALNDEQALLAKLRYNRLVDIFLGVTAYSLWSDWFFIDSALNFNGLTLDHQSPALGANTNTYLNSIGARLDAGTRTNITDNTFAEPILAVSWVRTSFEEISLGGGEIQPDDAESLRAGLGLRLGATLPGETVSASYYVTGRGWYEFEGESGGVINNPGDDLPFADEFTGAFGEAELGLNVFNAANTLSAFTATGVKWQDGYSPVNLSLGVRMAW